MEAVLTNAPGLLLAVDIGGTFTDIEIPTIQHSTTCHDGDPIRLTICV